VATHKSAIKKAKQDVKRTARNSAVKSRVRSAVRTFRDSLTSSPRDAQEKALLEATREIRIAASKGVLHKNTASRHVSRLVLAFNAKAAS